MEPIQTTSGGALQFRRNRLSGLTETDIQYKKSV